MAGCHGLDTAHRLGLTRLVGYSGLIPLPAGLPRETGRWPEVRIPLLFLKDGAVSEKLYVGNLPYETTREQLAELFAAHGEVLGAQLVIDRQTDRPRGFAFVEMSSGASAAAAALNGQEFHGRFLTVNEARPRDERTGEFGGLRRLGRADVPAPGHD